MLSELRAEDTGEVCFQAGPAQSLARLEVEGKLLRRRRQGRASSSVLGLTDWPLVLEMLLPSSLLFEGPSWGRSQRAAHFLKRRWRGRDFERGMKGDRPWHGGVDGGRGRGRCTCPLGAVRVLIKPLSPNCSVASPDVPPPSSREDGSGWPQGGVGGDCVPPWRPRVLVAGGGRTVSGKQV